MKPQRWRTADGTRLTLRPMLKSDAPLLKESLGQLSRESRRNRFFSTIREFSDEMVDRLTHFDTATEFALVVVRKEKDKEIPLAGGRFVHESDGRRCEFSLLIGDAWQGQRIGHRILRVLVHKASQRGLQEMEGHVLADNQAMLRLARTMGFLIDDDAKEAGVKLVRLALPSPKPPRVWRQLFRKLLRFGRK